ncbi:MAG: prephenate dehydratase [Planctomycetaceae bacterium]|jgi:prephenate dehydratase|nr:prephenate dehydratase [Planctomycetaceae bacterium]
MNNIAIQGIEGSYHAIAARKLCGGDDAGIVCCRSFQDVAAAVNDNPETLGLMAIENTIAGSLLKNYELIRKNQFIVCGEYKLRISHCLAALPGTEIIDLKEIDSHPMAFLQCERFLEQLFASQPDAVRIVEKDDTASSARWISENRLKGHAAICSQDAAKIYGLNVLQSAIETDKHNFTRFVLLHHRETSAPEGLGLNGGRNKASLVFSLPHSVGSLSQVLAILSFYEMNLTKIESFPVVGAEWEYFFYVDLTFKNYARYEKAVAAARPLTDELTVLGEYTANE